MNLDRIALPLRADENDASLNGHFLEGDGGGAVVDEQARASASPGLGRLDLQQGGQPLIKTFLRNCPPSGAVFSGPLARATMQGLQASFLQRGHQPSPAMWEALTAVAETMEAMADGRCLQKLYLSSLDPGVGKTSVLIQFLKSLLRSEDHEDVAALVCIQRLDQIEAVVAAAGLPEWAFAVDVQDPRQRQLSSTNPLEARVVFTTHTRFERRCGGRSFEDVASYHYRCKPRQVRVWDEAILPGAAITLSRRSIVSIAGVLGAQHPALGRAL